MKIIIAGDIHGNYEYTLKLENLINKINPEKIILLGDVLYHGARNQLPNTYSTIDTVNILNKYSDKIIAVRGNCDSEVDDTVTNFDLTKDYIKIKLDGVNYYITHGHLLDKYNDLFKDNYIISGHTHVYNLNGLNINPGSVGIPRVNKEHTCLIYENKIFKLIDLDNFNIIGSKVINEEGIN